LSRPANILVVITTLHEGGAQRHVAEVFPRLHRSGNSITVFSLRSAEGFASQLRDAGVAVIEAPWSRFLSTGRTRRALGVLLAGFNLAWLMIKNRPTVVHAFLPEACYLAIPIAWSLRRRARIATRRSLNNYQRGRWSVEQLERLVFATATGIIANASSVARQLVEEEGAPPDRVGLIPNGIDIKAWVPDEAVRASMRAALSVSADIPLLLVVANFIPYKGHSDLIMALGMLVRESSLPFVLAMAGRDDGSMRQLQKQATNEGLADRTRWLGMRRDVRQLLAATDVAVLPSHQEGSANFILEAMAASRPVVATDVGGNTELVEHGATGLIVPARSPRELATALGELLHDTHRRHVFGSAGQRRAERFFSLDQSVENYEALYAALASRQPLPAAMSWRP